MAQDEKESRGVVSTAFTWLEDLVYIGLGVLLAASALALLYHSGLDLVRALLGDLEVRIIVTLVDRILLALMIVELLYTLKVSFAQHALLPEPFLLVALIASVRRILVITVEFGAQERPDEKLFRQAMVELALLTILIVALAVAVTILRRRTPGEQESVRA